MKTIVLERTATVCIIILALSLSLVVYLPLRNRILFDILFVLIGLSSVVSVVLGYIISMRESK